MMRPLKIIPLLLPGAIAGTLTAGPLHAQEVVGQSMTRSGDDVVMTFDLADGRRVAVRVAGGTVYINDSAVGAYGAGPKSAAEWDSFARDLAARSSSDALRSLAELKVDTGGGAGALSLEALISRAVARAVAEALGGEARSEPAVPRAIFPPLERADAEPVRVSVVQVERGPGFAGGVMAGITNLASVFVALGLMGLGFVFFAPRQLSVVADTVWHSFGRSFLAGLFAQPLILPAFGMLLVGLALTVVGILLVPVAVVAFVLAVLVAAVGGYIAVARTVGEIYLRRRMARGASVATWGSYRYIVYGLAGLLATWLPAIAFGWIPVAGDILLVAAALITWVFATAGFGASILSRGGLRGTFVRKLDLALTDEHYWTAEGMPTPPPRHRAARYEP